MRRASALTVCIFCAAIVCAQDAVRQRPVGHLSQGSIGAISPIPVYPPTGVSNSPTLVREFLFLDPRDNSLVVSYPENVEDPAFAEHPGPRVELRVPINNAVAPFVRVSFEEDGDKIRYAYSIQNGAKARQPIASWSFPVGMSVLPVASAESALAFLEVRHPAQWEAQIQHQRYGATFVQWAVERQGEGIAPGNSASGFSLASAMKPGFVHAEFSSSSAGKRLSDLKVPAPVKKRLAQFEGMGFSKNTVLMIGPKYRPDSAKLGMIADYRVGIEMLARQGHVKLSAPYVISALYALQSALDQVSTSSNAGSMPASEYQVPTLVIASEPVGELEAQIDAAMRLCLPVEFRPGAFMPAVAPSSRVVKGVVLPGAKTAVPAPNRQPQNLPQSIPQ